MFNNILNYIFCQFVNIIIFYIKCVQRIYSSMISVGSVVVPPKFIIFFVLIKFFHLHAHEGVDNMRIGNGYANGKRMR